MKQFITLAILCFALSVGAQTDAKIYVKGNYFFIEKDDRLFEALRKEVLVKKLTSTSTVFYFKNINNWTDEGIDLANIKDESNTPYTAESWETFYTENTGNFKNGGDTGEGVQVTPLWVSSSSGGVYAINDIINHNGVFYKNITGTNTDTTPNTDTTNWTNSLEPDSGWIDVSGGVGFQNNWVDYETSRRVQYRKIGKLVQIRGVTRDGLVGLNTAIFTLPVGFRPSIGGDSSGHIFTTWHNSSSTSRVDVQGDGDVIAYSDITSPLSLEIMFFVD